MPTCVPVALAPAATPEPLAPKDGSACSGSLDPEPRSLRGTLSASRSGTSVPAVCGQAMPAAAPAMDNVSRDCVPPIVVGKDRRGAHLGKGRDGKTRVSTLAGVGEPMASGGRFLELFAGVAGLTRAVERVDRPCDCAQDVFDKQYNNRQPEFDLLNAQHVRHLLKLIEKRTYLWIHGAPPCKSFSRARRRDRWANARVLRSDRFPAGIPGPGEQQALVRDGNRLDSVMAKIARAQARAGGFFSIENPERSFMWDLEPLKALANLKGVRFVCGDQCCFGGPYRKPTAWLTNAPWLAVLERRCPGSPTHPAHSPLVGRVTRPDGSTCWLTECAAEYPEGLCNALAAAYDRAEAAVAPAQIAITAAGRVDPLEPTPDYRIVRWRTQLPSAGYGHRPTPS